MREYLLVKYAFCLGDYRPSRVPPTPRQPELGSSGTSSGPAESKINGREMNPLKSLTKADVKAEVESELKGMKMSAYR